MKTLSLVFSFLLVAFLCTDGLCHEHSRVSCGKHGWDLFDTDEVSVEIEDGSLLIINEDEDQTVEITGEYELSIDDRHIETDEKQQVLIAEYYNRMVNITEYARLLGIEGAKVGASGVKLGITAIAKVVKLLSEDYDENDLEKDMEREAEKLEKKAELLERKAERIEEMAEELEDLHYELRRSIPALKDLEWF
ncbi:MAG TPA: hypothetical protein VMX58_02370 [Patescibacteria group bacterium]|nr:hypothetical protein [Patescibacteria group bacterium]